MKIKKGILIVVTLILIIAIIFIIVKPNNLAENLENNEELNGAQILEENESKNNNISKKLAKDFTLTNLEGNEVTLSDFKGQKVYLNFWATWCPPCRAEMPYIDEINSENDNIKIITISSGESKETLEKYMKEDNYEFEVLLDTDGKVATDYRVYSIPLSVLIDEDGNIIDTHVGAMSKEEMIEFMRLD